MPLQRILLECVGYSHIKVHNFLVLESHQNTDYPSLSSTIAKAAIVILVMFSYPLQVHPCRASVDAVLKWRPSKRSDSSNSSPSRNALLLQSPNSGTNGKSDGMGGTRFAAITTAILVLSYIVAMTVSSLETVLAYVGSTGSTSISFILPGLFYYKISSPDSPHHQKFMKEDDDEEEGSDADNSDRLLGGGGSKGSTWRKNILRKLSLALAVYGGVVMVTCLVTNTIFVVAHWYPSPPTLALEIPPITFGDWMTEFKDMALHLSFVCFIFIWKVLHRPVFFKKG